MRTPNLGSIQYSPGDPPINPEQLQRFLRDEFQKIAIAVNALALGHLDVTYVAPPKPRKGDWRIADGTSWNPGSGFGYYVHNGTAWVLVKAL